MRPYQIINPFIEMSEGIFKIENSVLKRFDISTEEYLPEIVSVSSGDKKIIIADTDHMFKDDEIGINPFFDSSGEIPSELKKYYRIMSFSIKLKMEKLITLLLTESMTNKTPKLLNTQSNLKGLALDKKLLKEYQATFNNGSYGQILSVTYDRRNLCCMLNSRIFELDEDDEWNTVEVTKKEGLRTKTKETFQSILKAILDVKNKKELNEKYAGKARRGIPSRLDSFIQTYYNLLEKINPLLLEADKHYLKEDEEYSYSVPIKDIKEHIDKLEEYSRIMRGISFPSSLTKVRPVMNPAINIAVNSASNKSPLSDNKTSPNSSANKDGLTTEYTIGRKSFSISPSEQSVSQTPYNGGYPGIIPNLNTNINSGSLNQGPANATFYGDVRTGMQNNPILQSQQKVTLNLNSGNVTPNLNMNNFINHR